mgnify:FL=1
MSKRKHSNGVLDGVDFQLIVVDLIVCDYSQMNFVEKEVEKAFVADSFIDYLPLPPITKILMNVIWIKHSTTISLDDFCHPFGIHLRNHVKP